MPLTANPRYTGKDTAGLEFELHHHRLAIVVARCLTTTKESPTDKEQALPVSLPVDYL
jgi:hypothetical protein